MDLEEKTRLNTPGWPTLIWSFNLSSPDFFKKNLLLLNIIIYFLDFS